MVKAIRILYFVFIVSSMGFNAFAQDSQPLIRFGIIADIQYADKDARGSRFYRNSLSKLEEAVDSLNKQNVHFTVVLGDNVDGSFDDLDFVLLRLNLLESGVYHTPGNHDYAGVSNNAILFEKLGMPSEYYFFEKRNWIFVMLNTNEVATYSNIAGTSKEQELSAMLEQISTTGGRQGTSWNGGVSSNQLKWLKSVLSDAESSGKHVLIFSHHPLYPPSAHNALNYADILNIIGSFTCVKAIFAGHNHAGDFAYFHNIPVITIEGMVETETENSFGIVKIYGDKVVLEGKRRMRGREMWKK